MCEKEDFSSEIAVLVIEGHFEQHFMIKKHFGRLFLHTVFATNETKKRNINSYNLNYCFEISLQMLVMSHSGLLCLSQAFCE